MQVRRDAPLDQRANAYARSLNVPMNGATSHLRDLLPALFLHHRVEQLHIPLVEEGSKLATAADAGFVAHTDDWKSFGRPMRIVIGSLGTPQDDRN